jgi:transcriptional regulator with XRE-family HTH domain
LEGFLQRETPFFRKYVALGQHLRMFWLRMTTTSSTNNGRAASLKEAARGLAQKHREIITSRRAELRKSLRELGKAVGVSAGQLVRYENGLKHPTPAVHLRILAELGFGPHEFGAVLQDSPEAWLARRLAVSSIDPKLLGATLRKGRERGKQSLETLAAKTQLGIPKLKAIESGEVKPSPSLMVDLVGAWGLPPDRLQDLLPEGYSLDVDFAEQFLAALLEQAGFRVSKSEDSDLVAADIGGGWLLEFKATITRRKHQYGKNP